VTLEPPVVQDLAMPRTLTLSFDLLETFVALIRSGGDAAQAMRTLGVNQPTMSKRLRHVQHAGPLLERPWVVRRGKKWELTDEGKRVWPAVEELVDRYENLSTFLDERERAAGASRVRFACGQQMAAGLVRRALNELRKNQPAPCIRISTLRGRARIEGVSNGSLDLAIVTHDEPSILEIARRPLHIEPLATYRLALVCSSDSKWASKLRALPKAGVAPDAFVAFPLILPEPDAGVRKGLDEALRSSGVLGKLDVALEIGGWATILAYVRDGFGVGLVSEGALEDSKGLTVRLLDRSSFPLTEAKLIYRRLAGSGEESDLSEQAQAWRQVICRVARHHRPGAARPLEGIG
jgi:DNA-binding transcriptional LysR family regulator